MHWDELYSSFHGPNRHPYTASNQLHDRCFEVLYIVTLLEKGFGFDKHGRNIIYALEVCQMRSFIFYILFIHNITITIDAGRRKRS
jgi:hypothetical protein